jgi:hypothetical protein
VLGVLIGKSLAVKVVAGFAAMTVAGTGVAAETGALPASVQQAAHDVAGGLGVPAPREAAEQPETGPTEEPGATPSVAPSASPEPDASGTPRGPDASGPAARGLCQAYRSGGNRDSVAGQALAQAAGGADKVAAYCDGVLAEKGEKAGNAGDDRKSQPADAGKGGGSGTDKNGSNGSGKGSGNGSDKGAGNGAGNGAGKDKGAGGGKDKGAGNGGGKDKGAGDGNGGGKGKGKDGS